MRKSGSQRNDLAADGQVHPKPRPTELQVGVPTWSTRVITLAADPWRDAARAARGQARRQSDEKEV